MRPEVAEQHATVLPDPRRPGRTLALVACWCGRVYTLTGEQIDRHRREWSHPCPNAGVHPRGGAASNANLLDGVPA